MLSLSLQDDDAGLRGVLRLPSLVGGDLCRRITRACRCEPGFMSARPADAGGRAGLATKPVKAMYESWLPSGAGCPAGRSGAVGEGLSRECRAENELENAPLGDMRLVDSADGAAFSLLGGGGWEYGGSNQIFTLAVHAMSPRHD